ncbi:RDD family protein [Aureivirga sp. CE67]|uniref:RDD family protein n=1 Tax=Aureivirga sp. CE67 TaxID=1788983 RepID=UPI0018CBBADC|nr:RDD family protein [Aureivirga sp. CE67]
MSYSCPNCENELVKDSKFCNSCGFDLKMQYVEEPTCPTCKSSYPPQTNYCIKDGTKLLPKENFLHRCVSCKTEYPFYVSYCKKDEGDVKTKIIRQFSQTTYSQSLHMLEGLNQKLPKATLSNRFLAALIDSFIVFTLSIPSLFFFVSGLNKIYDYRDFGSSNTLFVFALIFYLLPLSYSLFKDSLGHGQSFGKKALDIMIIDLNTYMPCNKRQSFLRNFTSGLLSLIPIIGWLIEPVLVLASEDGRKIGDRTVNTQVIDLKNY